MVILNQNCSLNPKTHILVYAVLTHANQKLQLALCFVPFDQIFNFITQFKRCKCGFGAL